MKKALYFFGDERTPPSRGGAVNSDSSCSNAELFFQCYVIPALSVGVSLAAVAGLTTRRSTGSSVGFVVK